MRHYLAFHVWHARVQNLQQFSVENFMVRVHRAKVSANNFKKPFTDFCFYRQTKRWREIQDIFPFPFGLITVTSVIIQLGLPVLYIYIKNNLKLTKYQFKFK